MVINYHPSVLFAQGEKDSQSEEVKNHSFSHEVCTYVRIIEWPSLIVDTCFKKYFHIPLNNNNNKNMLCFSKKMSWPKGESTSFRVSSITADVHTQGS